MYGGVFQVVGFVTVVSGALVTIAYYLFRIFAAKWLETKFQERLKQLEHRQSQELENLRYEIGKLLDRATKLSEREFEVLPESWRLLVEFYHQVNGFTSAFQRYADVAGMSDVKLEAFLKDSHLTEWQKDELRNSQDRNKYWLMAAHYRRAQECREAGRTFIRHFEANNIFMLPDIASSMDRLRKLVLDALVEHEINIEEDVHPRERESQKRLTVEGSKLVDELTKQIRQRLWGDQLSSR